MHLTKNHLKRAYSSSSESILGNLLDKELYLCNKGTLEHDRVNGLLFTLVFNLCFLFLAILESLASFVLD